MQLTMSFMSPKQENIDLSIKLEAGFKLVVRKFYQQKAANDESVVIGDSKGGIKRVPAKDLLKDLDKE